MKSAGKDKGYACKRCGIKLPEGSAKIVEVPRKIELGLYEAPTRARRHLAKPLVRERKQKKQGKNSAKHDAKELNHEKRLG